MKIKDGINKMMVPYPALFTMLQSSKIIYEIQNEALIDYRFIRGLFK
jgi:hypothetical protein